MQVLQKAVNKNSYWLCLRVPGVFQHHSTGVNCERCIPTYYRSPDHSIESPLACSRKWQLPIKLHDEMYWWYIHQPLSSSLFLPAACDCQSEFTDGTCEDLTGRCFCKPNYTGENCDSCASGFLNFPECYRESQQLTVGRALGLSLD